MQVDLKFLKSWGAYNTGEIARFARGQAESLIERGVALEHAAVATLEKALAGKAPADKAPADKSPPASTPPADPPTGDGTLFKADASADVTSKGAKAKTS